MAACIAACILKVVPNWLSALRQAIVGATPLNRRREQRQRVKLHIEIRTSEGVTYPGVSRDLSERGMGALVTAPLAIGDKVHIKYEDPGQHGNPPQSIVRSAIVRQRFGYRYGFEFDQTVNL